MKQEDNTTEEPEDDKGTSFWEPFHQLTDQDWKEAWERAKKEEEEHDARIRKKLEAYDKAQKEHHGMSPPGGG